jgi:hypothetical protein
LQGPNATGEKDEVEDSPEYASRSADEPRHRSLIGSYVNKYVPVNEFIFQLEKVTNEVYGCIPKEAEQIYIILLQLSDMVADHPQPSSLSAFLCMKPF